MKIEISFKFDLFGFENDTKRYHLVVNKLQTGTWIAYSNISDDWLLFNGKMYIERYYDVQLAKYSLINFYLAEKRKYKNENI